MAKKTKEVKKSFVFYCDYRKHLQLLNDEERGQLLMALIDHAESGAEPELDGAALMAFSFIACQMDRDAEKYAETCRKRSEAGKQGGRPPKTNASEEETEKPPAILEKQEEAKKANGFSEKQTEAKKGDTDNDNDNDTDNDTDNDNDINNPPYTPPRGTGTGEETPKINKQEERFARFWEAYPKKVGKKDALKKWNQLKPDAELFLHIMRAVTRAKKSKEWTREGGRFIPNPATWINQGRWDDVLTPADDNNKANERRSSHGEHRQVSGNETKLSGFRMADE